MKRKTMLRLATPVVALSLMTAACGSDKDSGDKTSSRKTTETTAMDSTTTTHSMGSDDGSSDEASGPTETGAATLRAGLTDLLTEHVYLASLATGAALRGDQAGFDAYATALNGDTDSNTADLVAAVTDAYGDEVGKAFDGLWRSEDHIPAFVAYTKAAAADDQAGKDAAVKRLTAYAKTFGETLNSVNENLPADAVEKAITAHATTLLKVIDAQKAGDAKAEYAALREAYHHMDMTAATLAGATVAKLSDKFDGEADAAGAELRAGLHSLLREHVWLAASATDAAIGGRQAEFDAAAAALNGETDSNTADLVAAITSVYGDEVGKAFDGLWRSEKHIPAFVAFTKAVAAGDEDAKDKALEDLTAYAKTFGETLNSVNENLPADAVQKAIEEHAATLTKVIEAQKVGDPTETASLLREAVHHMSGTGDVLAAATAKQFPDKF